ARPGARGGRGRAPPDPRRRAPEPARARRAPGPPSPARGVGAGRAPAAVQGAQPRDAPRRRRAAAPGSAGPGRRAGPEPAAPRALRRGPAGRGGARPGGAAVPAEPRRAPAGTWPGLPGGPGPRRGGAALAGPGGRGARPRSGRPPPAAADRPARARPPGDPRSAGGGARVPALASRGVRPGDPRGAPHSLTRHPRRLTMAQHLRVGVIGTGFGSLVQIPAFQAHPRVEVVAVASGTPGKARAIAGRTGIPHAFDRWEALVEADLDLVSITAPPALHRPMALAALDAGRHVVCEKPMALSTAEAEEMLGRAERARRLHVIDH